jgi:hypothetical protein
MGEFTEIAESEAKQFISNVLCIDDEIVYDSQKAKPGAGILAKPGRGNLMSAEGNQDSKVSVDRQQLRADFMIAEFAKTGILCTPLNPRHIEKSYLDVVIAKADVIILDWEITIPGLPADQPAENYCLTIMEKLKRQDRFRLVIIYTGAGAEDIESEISKICPMGTGANIAWAIWRKPKSLIKENIINYEELPLRIIKKFASENSGILPAAVLRSLTGIRETSFRLLTTFTRDLDTALLYHRMLIPESEDAEEFCQNLIADEFLGIIKDANPGKYISKEYMEKYISEKPLKFLGLKSSDACYSPEEFKRFLTTKLTDKEITDLYKKSKFDNQELLKRFSAISTTRTSENSFLQLGCVLELKGKGEPPQYYLCLQPPCDSVRIKERTGFIFCGLAPNPPSHISFYLYNEKEYTAFKIEYQSKYVFVFKGEDKISLNGDLVSENNEHFTSIGQLKPMFAQKIANDFASRISRVGIEQFEWLRLQG